MFNMVKKEKIKREEKIRMNYRKGISKRRMKEWFSRNEDWNCRDRE